MATVKPADLLPLLRGAFSSLTIGFNDCHAPNYMTAQQWEDERGGDDDYADWISDEEKQKALAANQVWTIQWYPETPGGFYALKGSTFEAVARAALDLENARKPAAK